MRTLCLAALPLWIVLTSGCGQEPLETSGPTEGEEIGVAEQPEVWSSADDPAIFTRSTEDLERRAAVLPESGEAATTPWTGSYWPTAQDSINFRWNGAGSDSAAKKYELAFGLEGVEDKVSKRHGIESVADAKVCTEDKQCKDGERCGKRAEVSEGRCIPKWYGICHGWAAAAILFPEPEHAVVQNGVTFEVQDIKALLSLVHNATSARFVSVRCNDKDGKKGGITYDEHGRATPACRDTNAGTFHLLLTNFLGLRRQSFIEDRVFDQQVYNQPIRAYEVLEQRTVSEEEAHQLIGAKLPRDATGYLFNPDAASFAYVKTDLSYIKEVTATTAGNLSSEIDAYTKVIQYEYVLELDADGAIIGGEWARNSKRNHPDFVWLPLAARGTTVAGGAISYAEVEALAKASVAP